MNFKRGLDPHKALKIGEHQEDYFRIKPMDYRPTNLGKFLYSVDKMKNAIDESLCAMEKLKITMDKIAKHVK